MLRRLLLLSAAVGLSVIVASGEKVEATITVEGTAAQRAKLAQWLSSSLGTTVSIDANGKLTVAAGGNAAADRLRTMADDPNVSPVLEIVVDDPSVEFGGWKALDPDTDRYGKTTGRHKIDITDIEGIGNIFNTNGLTPDAVLMHEITEVYWGLKMKLACWAYNAAHFEKGIEAEKEVYGIFGAEWLWTESGVRNGQKYSRRKYKLPDGTYRIVEWNPEGQPLDVVWYKEKVPCDTAKGLDKIADPDPAVRIFSHGLGTGQHAPLTPIDTTSSHPTGVATDRDGNTYVAEDNPGQALVRVFSPTGSLIQTISNPALLTPTGLDVDLQTGDIFVSVAHAVIRFTNLGLFMGSYTTGDPNFTPSDVAVWRQRGYGSTPPGTTTYAIFSSDRYSSQVFAFDVAGNLNTGTYQRVFGSGYLSSPEGLTIDDSDAVWVASTGNHRIYAFSPMGDHVRFDTRDFLVEDLNRSFRDVANLEAEGVYVIDGTPGAGALMLYSYSGALLGSYGVPDLQCPQALDIHFQVDLNNLLPFPDPNTPPPSSTGIPVMSAWGICVLAIMLLGAGYLYFWRRREV
jgi:sugar lactone lactonase YvrE